MISTNNGGLSNRLKSYVSALRLDPNAKIYWPILNSYRNHNHILNCSFSKLFKNTIEVDTYTQGNIYNSHCLAIKENDNLPKNFNTFTSKCSVKSLVNRIHYKEILISRIIKLRTLLKRNIYNYLKY